MHTVIFNYFLKAALKILTIKISKNSKPWDKLKSTVYRKTEYYGKNSSDNRIAGKNASNL